MSFVELLIILVFVVGTICLAAGHHTGLFFNFLMDHRPTQGADEKTRDDSDQHKQGNLLP